MQVSPSLPSRTSAIRSPWSPGAPEGEIVDRVEIGGQDLEAQAVPFKTRWPLVAAIGVTVAVTGTAAVAAPPPLAVSADVQPQAPLAASYGVGQPVVDALSPASRATLDTIPKDMRDMYRSLGKDGKKQITDNLSQSSRVVFVSVSHRSAFIRGNVAGVDVFSRLEGRLSDAVKRRQVNPQQAGRMRQAITLFRHLDPTQRRALVELLEAEQRLAAAPSTPASQPKRPA